MLILPDTKPYIESLPSPDEILERVRTWPEHTLRRPGSGRDGPWKCIVSNGLSRCIQYHLNRAQQVPVAYYSSGNSSADKLRDRYMLIEPVYPTFKESHGIGAVYRVLVVSNHMRQYINLGPKHGAVSHIAAGIPGGRRSFYNYPINLINTIHVDGDARFIHPDFSRPTGHSYSWLYEDLRVQLFFDEYTETVNEQGVLVKDWSNAKVGIWNEFDDTEKLLHAETWWETRCPGTRLDMSKPFPFGPDDLMLLLGTPR